MPDSPSNQDLPGEPVDAPDPELPTEATAHLAATGWGREGQGSWAQSNFTPPAPPALTPPALPHPPLPGSRSPHALQAGEQVSQLLNLKLLPLYSSSQALPSGQWKKPHQKNISLLIWVPTAFVNRIPVPQACSLSPPPHTLTATSGSLPGSVGPGLGSEASGSFLSLS